MPRTDSIDLANYEGLVGSARSALRPSCIYSELKVKHGGATAAILNS